MVTAKEIFILCYSTTMLQLYKWNENQSLARSLQIWKSERDRKCEHTHTWGTTPYISSGQLKVVIVIIWMVSHNEVLVRLFFKMRHSNTEERGKRSLFRITFNSSQHTHTWSAIIVWLVFRHLCVPLDSIHLIISI